MSRPAIDFFKGATSGQWLLGRFMITVEGLLERTFFPNYLQGPTHTKSVGGAKDAADIVIPQILDKIRKIQRKWSAAADSGSGGPEFSIFGHSLGGDITAEFLGRLLDSGKLDSGTRLTRAQEDPATSAGGMCLWGEFFSLVAPAQMFKKRLQFFLSLVNDYKNQTMCVQASRKNQDYRIDE